MPIHYKHQVNAVQRNDTCNVRHIRKKHTQYGQTAELGNSTYAHEFLLTPRSRVLLQKLTGSQLDKKFPALYGIRRLIIAFTTTCHLSLS
jgi:hypothetical protein